LGDASASWCKCLANLDASSLRYRRLQPVEVAGDDLAKSVMIRLLTMVGFEPLDCGGIDDCAKIEPGYHSRRWKHPKHLAYHGQNHP
jgi:predicted dinucleotide-binding enzyme